MIDKYTGRELVSPADSLPPEGIATDRPNDMDHAGVPTEPSTAPEPADASRASDGSSGFTS